MYILSCLFCVIWSFDGASRRRAAVFKLNNDFMKWFRLHTPCNRTIIWLWDTAAWFMRLSNWEMLDQRKWWSAFGVRKTLLHSQHLVIYPQMQFMFIHFSSQRFNVFAKILQYWGSECGTHVRMKQHCDVLQAFCSYVKIIWILLRSDSTTNISHKERIRPKSGEDATRAHRLE